MIGFDVADPAEGATSFPGNRAPTSPVGMEFVLQLDSGRARILATPRANPFRMYVLEKGVTKRDRVTKVQNWLPGMFIGSYGDAVNNPSIVPASDNNRFEPLYAVINRARIGRDSTNFLGFGYDRGVLPHGPLPDGAWETADWYNAVEVRIPWNLINVTDPSSRHVAHEPRGTKRVRGVGTRQVDAIRMVAAAQDSAGAWQVWPASQQRADVASFTWPTWDEPRYRVRRRPVFEAMRTVFNDLTAPNSMKVSQP